MISMGTIYSAHLFNKYIHIIQRGHNIMLGHFYNKSIRKYIVLLQSLFSNVYVARERGLQQVPITYASKERFIAKLFQDIDTNCDYARVETILPRMYIHLVNMQYDPSRKTNVSNRQFQSSFSNGRPAINSQFNPVPYDFEFEMGIWTRHQDDMFQIIEQILPYFQPDFTCQIKELDENELVIDKRDIPIIIESIQMDEDVEGDPSDRRRIQWVLSLRMKGWLYPPTNKSFGIIKTIYLDFNEEPKELVVIHGERETVKQSLTMNWTMTEQVNQSLDIEYIMRNSSTKELVLDWTIRSYVSGGR